MERVGLRAAVARLERTEQPRRFASEHRHHAGHGDAGGWDRRRSEDAVESNYCRRGCLVCPDAVCSLDYLRLLRRSHPVVFLIPFADRIVATPQETIEFEP